ncbi:MAG: Holliday junction branch migration protein RuvA [Porphyromonas sp.]|nr:Holliday junction branch migration protein RuvA [Porphyromonas sp.]
MIEYIKGAITSLHPTTAVIEASGIGYEVHISLFSYNLLQGVGESKVYIHEIIREDAHDLFGFVRQEERAIFRLLITVNGVGANTARLILSSYSPAELSRHISLGNAAALKGVKGIGAKTSQRIILDLKDKIAGIVPAEQLLGTTTTIQEPESAETQAEKEEAVSAFVVLGYPRAAAKKVVDTLFKKYPELSLNEKIKKGLTML